MTNKITDKAIRNYYGHNGTECRVRISRDGSIHRYGSPVTTDRSKDFWALVGDRASAAHEIARQAAR